MKQTWHRADASIGQSHKPGTMTAFFKYDLCHWTFGFSIEPDDCWMAFHLHAGPFEVELCYWRLPTFEVS